MSSILYNESCNTKTLFAKLFPRLRSPAVYRMVLVQGSSGQEGWGIGLKL